MDKELPFMPKAVNKETTETSKEMAQVESRDIQTNSESSISQTVLSEPLENIQTDNIITINDAHKQMEIQKVIPKTFKQVDSSLLQKTIIKQNVSEEKLIKDLTPITQELTTDIQLEQIKNAAREVVRSSQNTPEPELYKTSLATSELIDKSILERDGTSKTATFATTTQISKVPVHNLFVPSSYDSVVNPGTLKTIHVNGISAPANIASALSSISPELIQDSILVPVNNISTHVINDPIYNSRTILGGIDNTLNNGKVDPTNSLPIVLNCSHSSNESNIIEDNSPIDLQKDVALNITHSPKTYINKGKETLNKNWGNFMSEHDKILPTINPIETNPALDLKIESSVDDKTNLNRKHKNSFMTPAQRKYMQDDERDSNIDFSKAIPSTRISAIGGTDEHLTITEFSTRDAMRQRDLIDTTKVHKTVPETGMINLSPISNRIPITVNKYELISNTDLITNDIPLQLSSQVTPDSFAINFTSETSCTLPNLSQIPDNLDFDPNIHVVNGIESKSHNEFIYHTPVEYIQPEVHQKWISYVDPTDSSLVIPAPSDLDEQNLNLSRPEQTSLPLKKRRKLSAFQPSQEIKIKSLAQEQNDISYPSTPMMSIAEVKLLQSIEELQEVGKPVVFKTPGQLKFIPVPTTQHNIS